MSKTKLTIYQGIYLFSKLAENNTDINKLKIDNNDLSLVPPEYLSKGIVPPYHYHYNIASIAIITLSVLPICRC